MNKKSLLLAVSGISLILMGQAAKAAPPEEDEWCTDQENEGRFKQYPLSTNSIYSCSDINYGLIPPVVPEVDPIPTPTPPYSS